ncbi:nucleotidyltransferase family protein [Oscillospiraceae bacterium NTUH-002-81]|nr:nucleotidyltransferase family protein [Oscillospiraceae bacterium NTUH-002-81]
MNVTGVIAEYNPFHNGHRHHLSESREKTGADYVIAVMSGDFVQRGTPAILNKYERTRMALSCGADLVLELPAAYATASAEHFALGGVALLDSLGAMDALAFGAEVPVSEKETANPEDCIVNAAPVPHPVPGKRNDILLEMFQRAADCLLEEPPVFQEALRQSLKEGLSFPKARMQALQKTLASFPAASAAEVLSSPNNILGLEYVKALKACKSSITPCIIPRSGSGYHDTGLSPDQFASATGIRAAIARQLPTEQLKTAVPDAVLSILKENEGKSFPVEENDFSALLRYRLLMLLHGDRYNRFQAPLHSDSCIDSQAPLFAADTASQSASPLSIRNTSGQTALTCAPAQLLSKFADMTPDLAARIADKLPAFVDAAQFTDLLKAKNLTRTRIARCLTHILLDVEEYPFRQLRTSAFPVPYARILGFRKEAAPLLSVLKKTSRIPLITKTADATRILQDTWGSDAAGALWLWNHDLLAVDIYETAAGARFHRLPVNEYTRGLILLP